VLDGAIVIRTDLYSVVADGTRDSTVAFQADELDDRLTSGWSVLVVGHAEHVDDPKEMAALFQRMHQPWAPGLRPLVARIVPAKVTGRRFTREG
jgi:nitroimidazol reductase NimA-like FMN-containing flavoprotein (pyridoxamine 5'-phosphate oxidase superfamily)